MAAATSVGNRGSGRFRNSVAMQLQHDARSGRSTIQGPTEKQGAPMAAAYAAAAAAGRRRCRRQTDRDSNPRTPALSLAAAAATRDTTRDHSRPVEPRRQTGCRGKPFFERPREVLLKRAAKGPLLPMGLPPNHSDSTPEAIHSLNYPGLSTKDWCKKGTGTGATRGWSAPQWKAATQAGAGP